MDTPNNINMSLNLPRVDLDRAIAAAVEAQVASRIDTLIEEVRSTLHERQREINDAEARLTIQIDKLMEEARSTFVARQREINKELESVYTVSLADKESVEKIREAAVKKQGEVNKDLDSLFTQVAGAKRDVEGQLDKIRESVTRRANWYLIPTATIILLAGILGLWAVVGANANSLRTTVNATLDEARKLQKETTDGNAALASVQQNLIQAQGMVLSNQAAIEQLKQQNPFADHTQKLKELGQQYADLSKRMLAAEDWIAKHKK
jgi:hypothetical protein